MRGASIPCVREEDLSRPTLVLHEERVRRNIQRMRDRVCRSGVLFRPHFKTHNSPELGEWFKYLGVDRITVSSIEMAETFASAGWRDITIAFPVNIRGLPRLRDLADRASVNVILDAVLVFEELQAAIPHGA